MSKLIQRKLDEVKLLRDSTMDMAKIRPIEPNSPFLLNCFTLVTAPIGSAKTSLLYKAANIYKNTLPSLNIFFIHGNAGPDETFARALSEGKLPVTFVDGNFLIPFLKWFEVSRKLAFELSKAWNSILDHSVYNVTKDQYFLDKKSYSKLYNSMVLDDLLGTIRGPQRVNKIREIIQNYIRPELFKVEGKIAAKSKTPAPIIYKKMIPSALKINQKLNSFNSTEPVYSLFLIDDMSQFPEITQAVANKLFLPLAQNIRHMLSSMWFAGQTWSMLSYQLKHSAVCSFGFGHGISKSNLNRSGTGIRDQLSTKSLSGEEIVEIYATVEPYEFLFINVPNDSYEIIKINM